MAKYKCTFFQQSGQTNINRALGICFNKLSQSSLKVHRFPYTSFVMVLRYDV